MPVDCAVTRLLGRWVQPDGERDVERVRAKHQLREALRDPATLNEVIPSIEEIEFEHTEGIMSAAFHPNHFTFACGGHAKMVEILDISNPEAIRTIAEVKAPDIVWCVRFSPQGTRLGFVTTKPDLAPGALFLVDTEAYQSIVELDIGAQVLGFHPKEELLAVACKDQIIRLVRADDGDILREIDCAQGRWDSAMEWSPKGTMLACCAAGNPEDGCVLLDIEAETKVHVPHGGRVWNAAFHPTEAICATACGDKKVRFIDPGLGAVVQEMLFEGECYACTFDPQGRVMAIGLEDWSVRLLDYQTGIVERVLHCHGTIRSIDFDLAGEMMVIGTAEWSLRPIKPASLCIFAVYGATERSMRTKDGQKINALAFSPDGHSVFAGDMKGVVYQIDTYTSKVEATLTVSASASSRPAAEDALLANSHAHCQLSGPAFSASGRTAFFGYPDGLLVLRTEPELSIVQLAVRPDDAEDTSVVVLDCSHCCGTLAAAVQQGNVWLVDADAFEGADAKTVKPNIRVVSVGAPGKPLLRFSSMAMAIDPAIGTTIVMGTVEGKLVHIDVPTATVVREEKVGFWICCVAFSPDGDLLAYVDKRQTGSYLHVIDVAPNQQLFEARHPRGIGNIVFVPHARSVMTMCVDGIVREFNLETGTVKKQFFAGTVGTFMAYTPEVGRLALGCATGEIRIVTGDSDPFYALGRLLDDQLSMESCLSTYPSWATRRLPPGGCTRGLTLLHLAVLFNRGDWALQLCARGAHPLAACHDGGSAVDFALDFGQLSLARDIIQALVKTSPPLRSRPWPRSFACTLARMVSLGVPCDGAFSTMLPANTPQSIPPTQMRNPCCGKRPGVRTECASNIALADYSSLAPPPTQSSSVAVLVEVCRVPGLLDPECHLLQAMHRCPWDEIFASPVVEAIVQHLWRAYGFYGYLALLTIALAGLALFVALSVGPTVPLAALLLVVNIIRLYATAQQVAVLGCHSLAGPTLAAVVFQLLAAVFHLSKMDLNETFLSVGAIVSWTDLLLYLRGFESPSMLLMQIRQIVQDLLPFASVFVLSLFGLTHAYLCLQDGSLTLNSLVRTMATTFTFMVVGEKIEGVDADSGISDLQPLVSVLCSVLGFIVMLNMIIALLCDTFERVQEQIISIRLREIISLLLAAEGLFRPPRMEPFFFLCSPHEVSQAEGEERNAQVWRGFLGDLKGKVSGLETRLSRTVDARFLEVQDAMQQVDGRIGRLENGMRSLSVNLAEVLPKSGSGENLERRGMRFATVISERRAASKESAYKQGAMMTRKL